MTGSIKAGWESWLLCEQLTSTYIFPPETEMIEVLLDLQVAFHHCLDEEELVLFLFWVKWIRDKRGEYNISRAFWFTGDEFRKRQRWLA